MLNVLRMDASIRNGASFHEPTAESFGSGGKTCCIQCSPLFTSIHIRVLLWPSMLNLSVSDHDSSDSSHGGTNRCSRFLALALHSKKLWASNLLRRSCGMPQDRWTDLFSHLSGPKSFRLLSARTALPRTSKNLKRFCPGTREPYSWRRYQKASYDFLWPILAHAQIISNLETIWNLSSSVPMLRRVLHAGSVVLDLRLPATVVAEPP